MKKEKCMISMVKEIHFFNEGPEYNWSQSPSCYMQQKGLTLKGQLNFEASNKQVIFIITAYIVASEILLFIFLGSDITVFLV